MESELVRSGAIQPGVDSVFDWLMNKYADKSDAAVIALQRGFQSWDQAQMALTPLLETVLEIEKFVDTLGAIKTRFSGFVAGLKELALGALDAWGGVQFGGAR
jgi:hypothetical protein